MLILLVLLSQFSSAETIRFKSHETHYLVEKTKTQFIYESSHFDKKVKINKCNRSLVEEAWSRLSKRSQKGAKNLESKSLANVKINGKEQRYFGLRHKSRMYLYRFPKKVHVLFREIYQKCGKL